MPDITPSEERSQANGIINLMGGIGWAIQLTGNNYNVIMLIAPFFLLVALVLMLGVRRGEAPSHVTIQITVARRANP